MFSVFCIELALVTFIGMRMLGLGDIVEELQTILDQMAKLFPRRRVIFHVSKS